jgi:hypothetical protein
MSLPTILFKAPSTMGVVTKVFLRDGTQATIDANGYVSATSDYTESLQNQGFVVVDSPSDPLPVALYTAMTDTTNATILSAAMLAKNAVIEMTGTLGGGATLTLPVYATLVAAVPEFKAGMVTTLRVINGGAGNFAWTLTTAAGWGTLNGAALTSAQYRFRDYIVTFTSATAGTIQAIGTSNNSGV